MFTFGEHSTFSCANNLDPTLPISDPFSGGVVGSKLFAQIKGGERYKKFNLLAPSLTPPPPFFFVFKFFNVIIYLCDIQINNLYFVYSIFLFFLKKKTKKKKRNLLLFSFISSSPRARRRRGRLLVETSDSFNIY